MLAHHELAVVLADRTGCRTVAWVGLIGRAGPLPNVTKKLRKPSCIDRHRRARAKAVALVSPSEVAVIQNTDEAIRLDEAIKLLQGVNIVLVEGFHTGEGARIEVRRTLQEETIIHQDNDHLMALIAPEKYHGRASCSTPDKIKLLAELIEKRIFGQDCHHW